MLYAEANVTKCENVMRFSDNYIGVSFNVIF